MIIETFKLLIEIVNPPDGIFAESTGPLGLSRVFAGEMTVFQVYKRRIDSE